METYLHIGVGKKLGLSFAEEQYDTTLDIIVGILQEEC